MFNFESGTALAIRQDKVFSLISNNNSVSSTDYRTLKDNLWVPAACKTAPCNLTVRHLVLLDLIEKRKARFNTISSQISLIAPDLWAEGYSYWCYTKSFLKLYNTRLDASAIRVCTETIENLFIQTSYLGKEDILRPAPFGDLRDQPLDSTGVHPSTGDFSLRFLSRKGNVYYINPYILGLNGHVPTKSYKVEIINGIPYGFIYYTGYENKVTNTTTTGSATSKVISAVKNLFRF